MVSRRLFKTEGTDINNNVRTSVTGGGGAAERREHMTAMQQ